jgi:WD40 repeat protein
LSDGSVRLRFAVAGGAKLGTLKHDGGAINAVVFSADGRMIATGGNDATARIFGVEEQNQIYRMPHEKAVEAVAFTPTMLSGSTLQLTAYRDETPPCLRPGGQVQARSAFRSQEQGYLWASRGLS